MDNLALTDPVLIVEDVEKCLIPTYYLNLIENTLVKKG